MEKLLEIEIVHEILEAAFWLVIIVAIVLVIVWILNKPISLLDNKSIWQRIRGSLVDEFKAELDSIRNEIIKVDDKLDNHIAGSQERHAKKCRLDILDFNEEILLGIDHTKEHFEEMLEIIDQYKDYCETHPDFPNNKCILACENIEETYKILQKEVTKENMKKKGTVKKAAKSVKNK